MINIIIDAISITLHDEFNTDDKNHYKIYTEEVLQGLKTPCFFINALNPKEDLFRDNKYKQINQFCIQYIPNDSCTEKKHECNEVRDKLFNLLEYITICELDSKENTVKSLIRGKEMHGEYSDGVLNFFVNYDIFVKKEKIKAENMDSCDYNSEIMEG